MIHTGVFQGCFPISMDTDRCMQLTSKLGFDGLEMVIEDEAPLLPEALDACTDEVLAIGRSVGVIQVREGALTVDSSPSEVQRLNERATAYGIRIHSVASVLLFFYPLSSPVAVVRDKGIDVVLKMMQAASVFGASTVLVIPGLVTPNVGYREAYDRSQAVIRDLATEASRLGVVLGLENVWNRFLLSPLEMARFIEEIASPSVGAYFDVANILTYGYPEDWLRILGSHVRAVHFKDYKKDVDNIRAFVHLLHGDVDWPAVALALSEIDYSGFVTAEVPALRVYPEKGLADTKSAMDLILANISN